MITKQKAGWTAAAIAGLTYGAIRLGEVFRGRCPFCAKIGIPLLAVGGAVLLGTLVAVYVVVGRSNDEKRSSNTFGKALVYAFIAAGVVIVAGAILLSSGVKTPRPDPTPYPYESRISADCIGCTSEDTLDDVVNFGGGDLVLVGHGHCVQFSAGEAVLVYDVVRYRVSTLVEITRTGTIPKSELFEKYWIQQENLR